MGKKSEKNLPILILNEQRLVQKDMLKKESICTGVESAMSDLEILRKGYAERVVFFYPGEEGTFLTSAKVTLYANGILHAKNDQEEITTHISNVEVVWKTLDKNLGKPADKSTLQSGHRHQPTSSESELGDEPQLGQLIPLKQFQVDKPL